LLTYPEADLKKENFKYIKKLRNHNDWSTT